MKESLKSRKLPRIAAEIGVSTTRPLEGMHSLLLDQLLVPQVYGWQKPLRDVPSSLRVAYADDA